MKAFFAVLASITARFFLRAHFIFFDRVVVSISFDSNEVRNADEAGMLLSFDLRRNRARRCFLELRSSLSLLDTSSWLFWEEELTSEASPVSESDDDPSSSALSDVPRSAPLNDSAVSFDLICLLFKV